jgi:uncharacterized membrane protein
MQVNVTAEPVAPWADVATKILRVVLAFSFFAAGAAKLAGVQMMVEVFAQIGLGQGFRYVTGVVEIAGALALLTPGLAGVGAIWLATTMFFAVLTHLVILDDSPAAAALLLLLSLALAWLRRREVASFARRLL